MIRRENTIRHAPALLLAASAFLAIPAFAQEAAPAPQAAASPSEPVAPPRVVATLPENSAVTQNGGQSASPTPVNAEAAAQAAAEDAAEQAQRRTARRDVTRKAPRAAEAPKTARSTPASVAAPTPDATPKPAPEATPSPAVSPAADTTSPVTNDVTTDDALTNDTADNQTVTTTQSEEGGSAPIWPWLLAAIIVIGGVIAFLARRRRTGDEVAYVEPAHVEPTYVEPAQVEPVPVTPAAAPVAPPRAAPVAAPVAVAAIDAPAEPVVAEDATVVDAAEEDVAALTAAAPVSDRPWLEFALRPLRAGTNVDEALVEIELTVGNAGQVAAEDVRIATYMLESDAIGDLARLLADPQLDGAVDPVTIAPGEGTRIDATLALLKVNMGGTIFLPIIVADARYRLADGSEGRTSAAFQVGLTGEDGATLVPIEIDRPLMHDAIEARLYRQPDHS